MRIDNTGVGNVYARVGSQELPETLKLLQKKIEARLQSNFPGCSVVIKELGKNGNMTKYAICVDGAPGLEEGELSAAVKDVVEQMTRENRDVNISYNSMQKLSHVETSYSIPGGEFYDKGSDAHEMLLYRSDPALDGEETGKKFINKDKDGKDLNKMPNELPGGIKNRLDELI
jgi:hypothetical protein